MRSITNKALTLTLAAVLLVSGCSNGDPAPQDADKLTTSQPKPTAAPDPGTYNDEETQEQDTRLCVALQEQTQGVNQQMAERQEGEIPLDELHSQLTRFLDEEAETLVQTSQEASDALIPQDAEDFVLTLKFLKKYIQNGGEIEGQTVVITDSNRPALDTLEALEPVEAFQLQVAATEAIEEEELAAAADDDDEDYEHHIFGACHTLGVDVAPNAYNLHFTQETQA